MFDVDFGSSEGIDLPVDEQEALLRKSLAQDSVRRLLSPILCVSFGALPLGEHGKALVLAIRSDVPVSSLPTLFRLMPRPIHCIRFERDVMVKHLMLLNQLEGGLNLPTFESPDFLKRQQELERLRQPKVEEGIEPLCEIRNDEILLFDYLYRSEMTNLDSAVHSDVRYTGAMDVTFRVRDGVPTVYRKDALDDDAVLITRRQFTLRGTENAVGIGGRVVKRDELPYVIHPSEIQVRGVTATGLVVHNYDRDQYLGIGMPDEFEFGCTYYFLDAGQRQSRRLRIETYGLWRFRKSELHITDQEEWGDDTDLDRWFHSREPLV